MQWAGVAGAKSTGSIRGAVRALFRAQNAVPDTSAAAELPPRPSALTARGFQEVSLSDSPRYALFDWIYGMWDVNVGHCILWYFHAPSTGVVEN